MYGYYLQAMQERIILIVVVLLSAAEAQLHKILAIMVPRFDFSVEALGMLRFILYWLVLFLGFVLLHFSRTPMRTTFSVLLNFGLIAQDLSY